ncbi:hypothetical protein Ddye_027289 [Dipteronia dyeriana]|uniref:Ankyrin repeat protein n=1 Tax=Dipteronia dyeriana TaxID=168575 RepID=A0AAD9WQ18_9ROSI|nr:hypothetical protein Ddye_027289 [Dipteronia dyeriana]
MNGFFSIVLSQDSEKIKRELIDELDEHGRNLIHYTTVLSNVAIASQLIEAYQASSSSPGYTEWTTKSIIIFLEREDLINSPDKDKNTSLHLTAMNFHKKASMILVNGYPDFIVALDRRQCSILHLAALNGYLDIFKAIIMFPEMEDLINSPDDDKNTPFAFYCHEFP